MCREATSESAASALYGVIGGRYPPRLTYKAVYDKALSIVRQAQKRARGIATVEVL